MKNYADYLTKSTAFLLARCAEEEGIAETLPMSDGARLLRETESWRKLAAAASSALERLDKSRRYTYPSESDRWADRNVQLASVAHWAYTLHCLMPIWRDHPHFDRSLLDLA